ncbi:MAG: flagellar biosynthesis repressor FlbT [Rhodobiaceae bacterium]|nr:flagellar biosynthesis repressor FlbT [Rhodobiaceae bacterium]
MALKVELKPGERFILGDSVITNDSQRTRLFIDGRAPILREKDILTPQSADSPAKRIYLAVQLMYLDGEIGSHGDVFLELQAAMVRAAPSTVSYLNRINNNILTNEFYKALKEAKKLIAYEEELIGHATGGNPGVRTDSSGNRSSA